MDPKPIELAKILALPSRRTDAPVALDDSINRHREGGADTGKSKRVSREQARRLADHTAEPQATVAVAAPSRDPNRYLRLPPSSLVIVRVRKGVEHWGTASHAVAGGDW